MIAKDKWIHFSLNLGIYLFISAVFGTFFMLMESIVPTLIMTSILRYLVLNSLSFVTCLAMSFAKEYGDIKSSGFDWRDLLADMLGAIAGFVVISVLFLI